ncbi:hypothetical protein [Actinomycetospora sp. CA-053990]|uniref:hypothetical protein n=1 Tax=Actinomycetospora sp. CA-053990 TaxID=3239891 RepID=UPI003D8D2241
MPPGAETTDETDEELPTSLEDAADLLYGVGREEFIGVRDALVKQVRAAGDRELATEIGGLRKPSVAAWVANRLAREYPDEVEGLEELGGSLRDAQEKLEGDALRQLSRQRHGLINALVERGRRIAREEAVRLGDPAVRELEKTIGAALADPAAARALAGGQLAGGMEAGPGLGDGGISAALGGPASGARSARTARPSRPSERRPDRRPPARPAPGTPRRPSPRSRSTGTARTRSAPSRSSASGTSANAGSARSASARSRPRARPASVPTRPPSWPVAPPRTPIRRRARPRTPTPR